MGEIGVKEELLASIFGASNAYSAVILSYYPFGLSRSISTTEAARRQSATSLADFADKA